MSNIVLNKDDSRIIINRGLVNQSIESGLNIRVRDDSNLTDEADGKHIVCKLCASQKYHNFDFFKLLLQICQNILGYLLLKDGWIQVNG